ncbi:MAG: hypothetical protein GX638_08840 [Crenarchaeota archaeon]|nr:hypothetical protein [Thermoproteota archaeon]
MKKTAKAFAPAAISSFFEICDQKINENHNDIGLQHLGSRGGGFGLQKGVLTEVSALKSKTKKGKITVWINGKEAPEAITTITALQLMIEKIEIAFDIEVSHKIDVPIGAGFGTSAGGSLSACLALGSILNLPLTYNQIGTIAHIAEIKCQTGLGTVTPLTIGGCVLVLEPGAPGIGVIDRIPITPEYVIVAGFYGPTPTKQILASAQKRLKINQYGKITLKKILEEPTIENFLDKCWSFANDTGFVTERVRTLWKLAKDAGAIGATQNMVGEAIHAVVFKENALDVAEAFKQELPKESIFMSQIDFQGARLV